MRIELGFPWIIFFIFLTLKLCGVIAWSWWWVWSPLWISAIIMAFIFVLIGSITHRGW